MATRQPVILNGGTHDVLAAGDTLPGSAVQLSANAGNALARGSDGGLFVPSNQEYVEAVFTVGVGFAPGNPVPEVGSGWQWLPLTQTFSGQAGRVSAYKSVQGRTGAIILQRGNYFGHAALEQYNVPAQPRAPNAMYLAYSALDGSTGNNYPRINIGPLAQPFSNNDGTRRLLAGPFSFTVPTPSVLGLYFTPYGTVWNLDSQFQIFAAPLP